MHGASRRNGKILSIYLSDNSEYAKRMLADKLLLLIGRRLKDACQNRRRCVWMQPGTYEEWERRMETAFPWDSMLERLKNTICWNKHNYWNKHLSGSMPSSSSMTFRIWNALLWTFNLTIFISSRQVKKARPVLSFVGGPHPVIEWSWKSGWSSALDLVPNQPKKKHSSKHMTVKTRWGSILALPQGQHLG